MCAPGCGGLRDTAPAWSPRLCGGFLRQIARPARNCWPFYREAVGELDARLETVADWQEPYRKGVIYYLRDGRVRGVLLWNVWDQVEAARELIAQPGPFGPENLKGRLPA
ncbi:MAG: hypothetical protein HS126_33660 [Anaerolineales bacterium]|nr:hypothetical protein [Anaerolineales bacterium]